MSHTIAAFLLAFCVRATPCSESGAPVEASAPAKPITLADAERIALQHVPGGTIEDIERDQRLGKPVFEVDVRAKDGREHELVIDEDGRVIAEEIDG